MDNTNRHPSESRERAVRLLREHRHEYKSDWQAMCSIARIGRLQPRAVTPLCAAGRGRRRRARVALAGVERERLAELEKEVRELRRANKNLRKTAQAVAERAAETGDARYATVTCVSDAKAVWMEGRVGWVRVLDVQARDTSIVARFDGSRRSAIAQLKCENAMTLNECEERLRALDDDALIERFNREVGVTAWVSARARFLAALHRELRARELDFTRAPIFGGKPPSMSLGRRIRLLDDGCTVVWASD